VHSISQSSSSISAGLARASAMCVSDGGDSARLKTSVLRGPGAGRALERGPLGGERGRSSRTRAPPLPRGLSPRNGERER